MRWQEQAVCRENPDLWFTASARALAMHICRSHCPVVKQCAADAIVHPPKEGVQAGVAFNHLSMPFPPKYYTVARVCDRCEHKPARKPPTHTDKCGALSGYRGHLRRFEMPCDPCRVVAQARQRKWRADRLAREAAVREEKE